MMATLRRCGLAICEALRCKDISPVYPALSIRLAQVRGRSCIEDVNAGGDNCVHSDQSAAVGVGRWHQRAQRALAPARGKAELAAPLALVHDSLSPLQGVC